MRRLVSAELVLAALTGLAAGARSQEADLQSRAEGLLARLSSPSRKERLESRHLLLGLGTEALPYLASAVPESFEGRAVLKYVRENMPPGPKSRPVQAGTYSVGSSLVLDENPVSKVTLEAFRIDVYEVTNYEYSRFVRATSREPPTSWILGNYFFGEDAFPVVAVSYADAAAFARWAGGRLPDSSEWEVAATGGTERAYSWGDEPYNDLANVSGLLRGVGSESRDVSPFGCLDMVGSVAEWVRTEDGPAYRGGHAASRSLDQTRVSRRPVRSDGSGRDFVGFRIVNRRR